MSKLPAGPFDGVPLPLPGEPPHSTLLSREPGPYSNQLQGQVSSGPVGSSSVSSQSLALVPHSLGGQDVPAVALPPVMGALEQPNLKRPRGRPRKYPPKDPNEPKRKPGRPKGSANSKPVILPPVLRPEVVVVPDGEDVAERVWLTGCKDGRALVVLSGIGFVRSIVIGRANHSEPVELPGDGQEPLEILSFKGMLLPDLKAISLRQGSLSVIMGLADGRIVGGSISGPMIAHGTVKVGVGLFKHRDETDMPDPPV